MSIAKRKIVKIKSVKKQNWFEVLLNERLYQASEQSIEICSPAICVTTNYDKLQPLDGQRNIIPNHFRRMMGSLKELGYNLRQVIVVEINGYYAVADGNHLFNVCKDLGLPVEFSLVTLKTLVEGIGVMRKMNSTSLRWKLQQFINASAMLDQHYLKLQKLCAKQKERNKVTDEVMAAIMYNQNYWNLGEAKKAVTNGTFRQGSTDKHIQRMLNTIDRFYLKTGMDVYSYANKGLCNFIYSKGETYFEKEKAFLKAVKKEATSRNILSNPFGRERGYITFFGECWNKM